MKTIFAAALLSTALAVELESNRIVRQDDAYKGYSIAPYDKKVDYLRGNFVGGAKKNGYDFSYDELERVYPDRAYAGYGPGGLGYNGDARKYVGLYGVTRGTGRYAAGVSKIYDVLGDEAYYPVNEAYESSSDSDSLSFGSDSYSLSGSFSDSNDGQHDSDSGSQYDSAENDTAYQSTKYGFRTTYINSASEASSLSDYSLDERFNSTDSGHVTDGSADTVHCHYVNGLYTCHKHEAYQRGHLGIVTGERKKHEFTFEAAKTTKTLTHKDEGFDGTGLGPWTLDKWGNIERDPRFGK